MNLHELSSRDPGAAVSRFLEQMRAPPYIERALDRVLNELRDLRARVAAEDVAKQPSEPALHVVSTVRP